MITYTALSKRPKVFDRMVGVRLEEFELLHDKFVSSWKRFVYEEFVKDKKRKRAFGGGNQPRLKTTQDKLLFILMYTRLYPLQLVIGMWFDIDESVANRWVHRLTPLLDEALGYEHVLPKRARGRSLEEIISEFPDLKQFLLDVTEQSTRRSVNNKKQKKQYSGKKKKCKQQNAVLTNPNSLHVHWMSRTRNGSVHDKRIFDEEDLTAKGDTHIGTDLGFLGLEVGKAKITLPAKKPKGKELSVTLLSIKLIS